MFSEMVQRSEQLFFTPVESMDERLFHLPLFLEALASIVKEVDEVGMCVLTNVNNVKCYYALGRNLTLMITLHKHRICDLLIVCNNSG